MSDLQLGLLVIGILVVVGVIAYNKWQELRLQRKVQADLEAPRPDRQAERGGFARSSAPADLRRSGDPVAPERERGELSRAIEHTLVDHTAGPQTGSEGASQPIPVAAHAGPPVLEELVDYIVSIECPTAASGADILKQAGTLAHEAMHRPIHWEALDPTQGDWEQPSPQRRYRRIRAGMQLASRAGPATAEDIGAFCLALQEVALALGAELDLPDPEDAVRRASELDRFCAEVDVQVGLNVVAADGETFPGTKIRALAESAGMQYGKDGRFHRLSDAGGELFGMANIEPMPFHAETMRTIATRGVTIVLDVPRAPAAAATFRAFIDFARQAEQSLGGALVDDNRKPIDKAALDSIAAQLEALHAAMSAHGIAPGGALALRLFA